MDKKTLFMGGLVMVVAQSLLNLGIFVTFPQMTAYAVSNDSFQIVRDDISHIQADVRDIKSYLLESKK